MMITPNRPKYTFPRASSVIFLCAFCVSHHLQFYEKIKTKLISRYSVKIVWVHSKLLTFKNLAESTCLNGCNKKGFEKLSATKIKFGPRSCPYGHSLLGQTLLFSAFF